MDPTFLLSRLQRVRGRHPHFMARCPAHEDRSPSLSVTVAGDKILVHCFAGCPPLEIVQALGIRLSDLFSDRDSFETQRRIERIREATQYWKRRGLKLIPTLQKMYQMDHALPKIWIEEAVAEGWRR